MELKHWLQFLVLGNSMNISSCLILASDYFLPFYFLILTNFSFCLCNSCHCLTQLCPVTSLLHVYVSINIDICKISSQICRGRESGRSFLTFIRSGGLCLTAGALGWRAVKALFVGFADFCGVITFTVPNFKLPMWHYWTWPWEELCTINFLEPVEAGSSTPLVEVRDKPTDRIRVWQLIQSWNWLD